MDNLGLLAATAIIMFLVRIIAAFPVPILTILAAQKTKKLVPAWITWSFIGVAIAKLVLSIPYILIHPFARDALHIRIPMEQYVRVSVISGIASWWLGLLFIVAFYSMSKRMGRMAEPATGGYSPEGGRITSA